MSRADRRANTIFQLTEPWLLYLVVAFILTSFAMSVWGVRESRLLHAEVVDLVRTGLQDMSRDNEVFLTEAGWGIGQFPPNLPVLDVHGAQHLLPELADDHPVIYIAWDECPVCREHFSNLNETSAELRASGIDFAMLIHVTGSGLRELIETHQWEFPVFAMRSLDILDLNVSVTPAIMVFRNGVLGRAFSTSGLRHLVETVESELR